MSKINAPVSYFGGKSNMLTKLLSLFPRHYTHYVEPFGGAFSVGLSQERPNVVEIYNDLDQNIYSLYKTIADKELFSQLHQRLELAIYSEQMRLESLEALKGDLSMLDRAYHFFYSSRTSRNGRGGFSTADSPRRGMSKAVMSFLAAIDRLPELHLRLSTVMISNTDGIKLIEQYSKPDAMIYADPPYEQSTRSGTRYDVDMNRKQQIKFLETVRNTKAQCMISGYNCDLYNNMLGCGWERTDFVVNTQTPNGMSATKVESVWRNYGSHDAEIY